MTDLVRNQGNLTKLLLDQHIQSSLPKRSLQPFNGNPLQYTTFIRAFEYTIENKTEDNRDRLNFLCQYTSGEAKALVNSCLHYADSDVGYEKAKLLLAERYGGNHKIAQAVLKKAQNWPEIKEHATDSLNEFSMFLTEALNIMSGIQALDELNHTASLQMLVGKLPYRLRASWRNRVYEVEDGGSRVVAYKDLVDFVNRQARIMSNPVFGNIKTATDTTPSKKPSKDSKPRRSAFATSVDEKDKEKTCRYCGNNSKHALIDCRNFSKQDRKTKSDFCFKNSLCFGCLYTGHTKANCTHPELSKCSKCKKSHPTVLHDEQRRPPTKNKPTDNKHESKQPDQVKVNTSCVGLSGAQMTNPLMAIIPVIMKSQCIRSDEYVSTYAFIDNGCGAVFIDPELCNVLKVRTRQRKLVIGTLNSEEIVDTQVVLDKLQVGSVDGENFIDLPQSYVKDGIPVTLKDMPKQDDLDEWAHLHDIQLPELPRTYNAIPEVSIIIGMNVPEATLPQKVVTGEPGEPYAILTPIGWIVYGIPGKCHNQDEVMAHFCKIDQKIQTSTENLEDLFRAYVNHDFSEKLSDERKLSIQDKRFLKKME